MKLAEGLNLRKQLAMKVDQLKPIKLQGDQGLLETKTQRRGVNDQVDEVVIQTSKITLKDVARVLEIEYDRYKHHDALYDSSLTAKIFKALVERTLVGLI